MGGSHRGTRETGVSSIAGVVGGRHSGTGSRHLRLLKTSELRLHSRATAREIGESVAGIGGPNADNIVVITRRVGSSTAGARVSLREHGNNTSGDKSVVQVVVGVSTLAATPAVVNNVGDLGAVGIGSISASGADHEFEGLNQIGSVARRGAAALGRNPLRTRSHTNAVRTGNSTNSMGTMTIAIVRLGRPEVRVEPVVVVVTSTTSITANQSLMRPAGAGVNVGNNNAFASVAGSPHGIGIDEVHTPLITGPLLDVFNTLHGLVKVHGEISGHLVNIRVVGQQGSHLRSGIADNDHVGRPQGTNSTVLVVVSIKKRHNILLLLLSESSKFVVDELRALTTRAKTVAGNLTENIHTVVHVNENVHALIAFERLNNVKRKAVIVHREGRGREGKASEESSLKHHYFSCVS
eukprot:Rmarinus@m.17734